MRRRTAPSLGACILLLSAVCRVVDGVSNSAHLGPTLASSLDDDAFLGFLGEVGECADSPVPNLVFTGGKNKTETRLPSLTVEGVWRSSMNHSLDDITLCTNTGIERSYMLEGQCTSWGGPVVAILYLSLELFDTNNALHIEQARAQAADLHARMEEAGGCALDLVLVGDAVPANESWAYPYNSLRNQAIARARTRLVLLLDVDFLVSTGARERLLARDAWVWALDATYARRQAIVLPAFQTTLNLSLAEGTAVAHDSAAAGSKAYMKAEMAAGRITRFAPFFLKGHNATDYNRWFRSSTPYPITYQRGYEPFILVSRLHVPWFDERFRGYGWDKVGTLPGPPPPPPRCPSAPPTISHMHAMVATGFQLVADPSIYVVHRPHIPSAGYNHTFTGPAYTKSHRATAAMEKLSVIGMELIQDVKAGVYPEHGVTALAACRPLERWLQNPVVAWW
ncbi:Glycosyltransferase-like protein LARGE2 [Auxenochlorella protothecoides]|uniref:Glycosyltransferase-like protein LARGE2 n=1 Tax=Auxenochlorella protothecoides TaxID=3075 RepID=A0A087SFK7_AUXPR|nr:Glycosyltransferase-like protein LARGE2 [Auxenochlorella protothecoides]KFM24511.1 Glycosyltransferase-like protein LARGE2 [Auxenochlorella protothecoides]